MSAVKALRSPFVSSLFIAILFSVISFFVAIGFTFSHLNNRPLSEGILINEVSSNYRDYVIRGQRGLLASERNTARYFSGDTGESRHEAETGYD
tara:strand:+ start:10011 stop:10292 length:282 start_codon:yes stop_codon:yes gene_type:complete